MHPIGAFLIVFQQNNYSCLSFSEKKPQFSKKTEVFFVFAKIKGVYQRKYASLWCFFAKG